MRVNTKLFVIVVLGAALLIALWGLFSYTTDVNEAKVTQHSQKTSNIAILVNPQVVSPEIQTISLPLADKVSAWLNRVGRTPKNSAFAGKLLKSKKILAESIREFPDSLELRLADYYIEDDTDIPTNPAERKRYESDLLLKVGEVTRLSEGNTAGIWTAVDAFFRIGQPQTALEMLKNAKPSPYDSFGKASAELATDFYSNEGGLTLREAMQKTQDIAIARPRSLLKKGLHLGTG